MQTILVLLVLSATTSATWAQPAQTAGTVERRDGFWQQVIEGTLQAGSEVVVETTGHIYVTGDEGQAVRYRIVKKVKVSGSGEAQTILKGARLEAQRQGAAAVVRITDPDCRRCAFSADVELMVPRTTSQVNLETRGGSFEVVNIAGDVRAETAGGSISMNGIGGDVHAYTAGGAVYLGQVGGRVVCGTAGGPIRVDSAGASADLTTSGGDIEARSVAGNLRAETAGGNIRALKVAGSVTAATSGGSIRLGEVGGSIDAETAGGSIHADSAPKGVYAETAGGGIVLNKVAGKVVATSAAGPIRAHFVSGGPLAGSLLETAVGNIAIWLPATIAIQVDAAIDFASGSNRIQSEFDGIVVRRSDDGFGPGRVVAVGSINGGGPVLRIRNTNGRILIQKTAQE